MSEVDVIIGGATYKARRSSEDGGIVFAHDSTPVFGLSAGQLQELQGTQGYTSTLEFLKKQDWSCDLEYRRFLTAILVSIYKLAGVVTGDPNRRRIITVNRRLQVV